MTVFEAAHALGILPLLALLMARLAGRNFPPAWWGMAVAFAVSWLADSIAHLTNPDAVSQVYIVLQSGVAVLALDPKAAIPAVAVVSTVAVGSVLWRHGQGHDVAAHVTAGGIVTGLAWQRTRGWVRWSIVAGFGLLAVAWLDYVAAPGWPSWLTVQGVRLAAVVLWIVATLRDTPESMAWR